MSNGYFCAVLYKKASQAFLKVSLTEFKIKRCLWWAVSKIMFNKLKQNRLPFHVSPEKHVHTDEKTSPNGQKEFQFLLCMSRDTLQHELKSTLWCAHLKNTPRAASTGDGSELLCSLPVPPNNYHSHCCWPLGKGIYILHCQAPSYSDACDDLVAQQNVLNAPVFFEKPTLGISDHPNRPQALRNLPGFSAVTWDRRTRSLTPSSWIMSQFQQYDRS